MSSFERESLKMRRITVLFLIVGTVVSARLANGQSPSSKAKTAVPTIPDAVTKAPDWLKVGAPFDVATFLALPPGDQNAAPLYLDALLEFSPETADCFPPSAASDQRRQLAT